jgi:DNA-binding HxlR family transcriptional regulator
MENKELRKRLDVLEKESKTLKGSLKMLEEERIVEKIRFKNESKLHANILTQDTLTRDAAIAYNTL